MLLGIWRCPASRAATSWGPHYRPNAQRVTTQRCVHAYTCVCAASSLCPVTFQFASHTSPAVHNTCPFISPTHIGWEHQWSRFPTGAVVEWKVSIVHSLCRTQLYSTKRDHCCAMPLFLGTRHVCLMSSKLHTCLCLLVFLVPRLEHRPVRIAIRHSRQQYIKRGVVKTATHQTGDKSKLIITIYENGDRQNGVTAAWKWTKMARKRN